MSDPLSETKALLRKHCRALRHSLGEETHARSSRTICGLLETWPIFQQSDSILTYMPIKTEVDLTALLDRHPEKHWVIPRILPDDDHRMVFHPYDPTRLVPHRFGMVEPAPDLPTVAPADIQLALVPGLAFDRRGGRLGYGGGYFDRFLKDFPGVTLGIVFQALLLNDLPLGTHDVPMQWLITEAGILHIK